MPDSEVQAPGRTLGRYRGDCRYHLAIFLLLSNLTVRHWRFDQYSQPLGVSEGHNKARGRVEQTVEIPATTCRRPSIDQQAAPIQPEAKPHL